MKIALVQMGNEGTRDKNLSKSIRAISEAAENGADIVLFPEVQLTEFFTQYRNVDVSDYSLTISSEVVRAFCQACKDNNVFAVPNIYMWILRLIIRRRFENQNHIHSCEGMICIYKMWKL